MPINKLDTISSLIQGNDYCGAASFDGEKLLLATNKTEQSALIKDVKEFFTFVARKGKEIEHNPDSEVMIRKEIADKTEQLVINAKNSKAGEKNGYADEFRSSLNKITTSILATYLEPHVREALSKPFSNAMENQQYDFVPGQEGVHAEMKIAEKLLENNKLATEDVYIGVSKRCCENCAIMVESINDVQAKAKGGLIKEAFAKPGVSFTINTSVPAFLKEGNSKLPTQNRKAIETSFLHKTGSASLEEAYKNPPGGPELISILHDMHVSKAQDITKDSHVTPAPTPQAHQAQPALNKSHDVVLPHKKPF